MSSIDACCEFEFYSQGVPIPKDVTESCSDGHYRNTSRDSGFFDQEDNCLHDFEPLLTDNEVTSTGAARRSPFLRLPADIRNIIYNFTFLEPCGVHVDFNTQAPHPRRSSIISNPDTASNLFALSYTCKEIYDETCNLPFWLNTTHFHVPVLQDLWTLRNATFFAQPNSQSPACSAWPTFPPSPGARRRIIELPPASLTAESPLLRQKAQEYITLAMRLPHLDDIVSRLNCTIFDLSRVGRLNRVHVHLGSQTNNVFVERFFTAWSEVMPSLVALSSSVKELRISFALRISRRMVIDYEFGVSHGGIECLTGLDHCVVVPYGGDLTLPELATINSVRSRIWRGFFATHEEQKPEVKFRLARKAYLPIVSGMTNPSGFSELALNSMIAASA